MEENKIKKQYAMLSPYLNERAKRLYIASEALRHERGGKALVSRALGVSRMRIDAGISELWGLSDKPLPDKERIRRSGGGRKRREEHCPGLKEALENIISPYTRGDPENPLRWCSNSLRKIAAAMKEAGYPVSHVTIERLLHEQAYSLQANKKTDEDRDAQFCYINEKAKLFMFEKEPVISVDCKKKELIGNYKNNGREQEKPRQPTEVKVYDFPDKELGKAAPYGVYDPVQNRGWVSVGISSDTAEFAVNTIRTWWQQMGRSTYPQATKLLVTADGGGSTGSVGRLWKKELQQFATETGLEINVCHFPPGTSKWNKIEHRLFSYISKNWRGKPLISLETIVSLIANTTTDKGLRVNAVADEKMYRKGIKISDEEMKDIKLTQEAFRGKWNYKISG